MKVVECDVFMNVLNKYIIYAMKKVTMYQANLISWIIADLGMYSTTILMYLMLGESMLNFVGYSFKEVLLYISTAFLINNLFSILFSDACDYMCQDIWDGKMYYSLLKPRSIIYFYIVQNINLKSIFSTPLLLIFHIYNLSECNCEINIQVLMVILLGTVIMGLIFLLFNNLDFFGYHSDSLSPFIIQLLNIRERPDTIFGKRIRSFFMYIIPIFMTSSIPTRIQLNICNQIECILFYIMPLLLIIINIILYKISINNYNLGTEK